MKSDTEHIKVHVIDLTLKLLEILCGQNTGHSIFPLLSWGIEYKHTLQVHLIISHLPLSVDILDMLTKSFLFYSLMYRYLISSFCDNSSILESRYISQAHLVTPLLPWRYKDT